MVITEKARLVQKYERVWFSPLAITRHFAPRSASPVPLYLLSVLDLRLEHFLVLNLPAESLGPQVPHARGGHPVADDQVGPPGFEHPVHLLGDGGYVGNVPLGAQLR